jgi:hypothetical protein
MLLLINIGSVFRTSAALHLESKPNHLGSKVLGARSFHLIWFEWELAQKEILLQGNGEHV